MNDPYENLLSEFDEELKNQVDLINELEENKNTAYEKLYSIKKKIENTEKRIENKNKEYIKFEKKKEKDLKKVNPTISKVTKNSIINFYKEILGNIPIFKNFIKKKEQNELENLNLKSNNNKIFKEYSKGSISTIQIKYLLVVTDDIDNENKIENKSNERKINKDEINIFTSTFRINKNTLVKEIFDKACKYWNIVERKNFILIDDLNNDLSKSKEREINSLLIDKKPILTLIARSNFIEINNLNFKEENKDDYKKNLLKDVFDINFNKYFSALKTFFNNKLLFGKKVIKDDSEKFGDYSTKFIINTFFLLIWLIISNLLWNGQNKNIIRNRVENIIKVYDNNKNIQNINDKNEFLNYIKYIISENFKNYINSRNINFIGNISIIQWRSKEKNCEELNSFINVNNKVCYATNIQNENDLEKNLIFYDSEFYKTEKSIKYGNEIKNNNYRSIKGKLRTYNGSGYLTIVNFKNKDNLTLVKDLFDSLGTEYLKKNTLSIRLDFNLNLNEDNFNASIGILFENNGLGIIHLSNIVIDLYILEIYKNDILIFYFEIFMIFISLIFVYQFLKLLINLKRNKFFGYLFSKEGIINTFFLIFYNISVFVFIYFNLIGRNILIENSNLLIRDYFLDYYQYINLVNSYILIKTILFVLILIKISFGIISTKKGQIVLLALKKMGSKFIFFFLINIGFILSFSTIFYYVFGNFVSNFNSFIKSFLIMEMFTLRLSLFQEIVFLDSPFLIFIFIFTYIILVSIIGFFLTSFFIETIRIIFLETGINVIDTTSLLSSLTNWLNFRKNKKTKSKLN